MKSARIFLNGYYDHRYPKFYQQELLQGIEANQPLICADGGIRLFRHLNQIYGKQYHPNILIGDLDSFHESSTTETVEQLQASGTHIVREWVGQIDKDYTDGQLAVAYAIEECDCQNIIIYGGLPRPDQYETDHFLGNLKLMRFGYWRASQNRAESDGAKDNILPYSAEMRDALQTIHFVISALRLTRENDGLQRVSLIAEHANVYIESSENLRWDLSGLRIHPDMATDWPCTLRNEFAPQANCATIHLASESDPVYVIHNWYEQISNSQK